ncbi:ricin B lectin domain-containing protein [Zychaea mexicana]|uniref:ricin B lectin domain-containing protein n=1 Tax=Zychaea mexicana TaxID=64656 RepID=UPI0022FDC27B|nr:ricin B lectin domain-containing protein [Zychaea mexicana]KAI9492018.1 ricin B lectin domain-containing protein [Zychaea mexicana]
MFPTHTYFYIKSSLGENVVDVYNGETAADTELIIWPQKYNDNENQLWRYEDGYLINKKSEMVVDVRGGETQSDTPLIQYERKMTMASNQRWGYDGGFIHLLADPRMVLDIRGGGSRKGTKVILYKRKEDDNDNQRWIIEPFGQPFQPEPVSGPYGNNPYGTTPDQQPNPYGAPPPPNSYGSNPYGTTPQSGLAGYGSPDPYSSGAPIPYEQAAEVHREVYTEPTERKAHLSHQLIAGAAAFEAVKAYRRHQEAKGEDFNHGFLKQSVAALAATQIVKYAEEHDWSSKDKEEATRQAQTAADHYCAREFGSH